MKGTLSLRPGYSPCDEMRSVGLIGLQTVEPASSGSIDFTRASSAPSTRLQTTSTRATEGSVSWAPHASAHALRSKWGRDAHLSFILTRISPSLGSWTPISCTCHKRQIHFASRRRNHAARVRSIEERRGERKKRCGRRSMGAGRGGGRGRPGFHSDRLNFPTVSAQGHAPSAGK